MAHYTATVTVLGRDGQETLTVNHGSSSRADALGWAMHDAGSLCNPEDGGEDGEDCDVSRIVIEVKRDTAAQERDIKEQIASALGHGEVKH